MMTIADLLSGVKAIAAVNPTYRLGGDGSDGTCDCIGLIIGAVERAGESWEGVHGSNWWARNYTRSLLPVTDKDDLLLGDLVYKALPPGAPGYDLPSRYDKHPNKLDFYHVGVVTGVNPLEITHCTSPGGILRDGKLVKWNYHGQLTLIGDADEQEDAEMTETVTAVVTASSGSNVNMRREPSSKAALVDRVPIGAVVEVLERGTEWSKIRYGAKVGYMMTSFLGLEGGQEAAQGGGDADLAQRVTELTQAVAALQERVAELERRVAVG
jgi:hypothetical protein